MGLCRESNPADNRYRLAKSLYLYLVEVSAMLGIQAVLLTCLRVNLFTGSANQGRRLPYIPFWSKERMGTRSFWCRCGHPHHAPIHLYSSHCEGFYRNAHSKRKIPHWSNPQSFKSCYVVIRCVMSNREYASPLRSIYRMSHSARASSGSMLRWSMQ